MKKENKRISYIRKPFARRSFVSLPAAALALVCCAVSLGISAWHQGSGDANVAAWGFTSMVSAVVALVYGLMSFLEKEMNYLLARIGTAIGGILTLFWLCLLIVGVFVS